MLQEIADLGFEYVELSHGIRITLVPGLLRAIEDGIIKVASTHNFCPLPTGITQAAPNLFEPSEIEHKEHDQWLRHTRRSIDFAAQVKAKVLVCHLGSVKFFWSNPAREVREYLTQYPDAGRSPYGTAYRELVQKSLMKLRKRMAPYWDQTKASIKEVVGYAAQRRVKLGFENREKFEELPLDDDHVELLSEFAPTAPVGYWHDTGHADLKEGMALLNHREHLRRMSGRTLGFHLHDVSAQGHDHQPIGSGHIDFEMVSGFWRPEHLLTLELSPRVSVDDVRTSKARIDELIGKSQDGVASRTAAL